MVVIHYTCYTPNGQSCVDYCLVSPRLFDSVQTFSVGQLSVLSDHCPIGTVLTVKILKDDITEDYDYIESPKKLTWSSDIAFKFEQILQSAEYKLKVENSICNQDIKSQEGIDSMTESLTNILVEGTTLANTSRSNKLIRIPKNRKKSKRRAYHPKWHDLSCEEAYRRVAASARLLKCNPNDQSLGARIRQDIKDYKKLVKLRNKQFVENMFLELDTMEQNNPRGYMELIRAMRDGSFDKSTSDDTSSVSPSSWHYHSSNLLAKKMDRNDYLEQYIVDNINQNENRLNEPFSLEEVLVCLKG